MELESTLEREQEGLVNKLNRKVVKLEHDIQNKQQSLEQVLYVFFLSVANLLQSTPIIWSQLRREKGELENSLEQEQEGLVNKLWIRMNKLEAEKRFVSLHKRKTFECTVVLHCSIFFHSFSRFVS